MHEALHEFLLELPAPDNGKSFLFPSLAGKDTGAPSVRLTSTRRRIALGLEKLLEQQLPLLRGAERSNDGFG